LLTPNFVGIKLLARLITQTVKGYYLPFLAAFFAGAFLAAFLAGAAFLAAFFAGAAFFAAIALISFLHLIA
jgi:hypothetical protein